MREGHSEGSVLLSADGFLTAEQVLARAPRFASFARPAAVNGSAGLIVTPRDRPIAMIGFTISHDRIVEIDLVADPDKLRALRTV